MSMFLSLVCSLARFLGSASRIVLDLHPQVLNSLHVCRSHSMHSHSQVKLSFILVHCTLQDSSLYFTGARQLFWGDVHSTTTHFKPLFVFLAYSVVFCQQRERLDSLPTRSRAAVISVVSCFLPYYDDPEVNTLVLFCVCCTNSCKLLSARLSSGNMYASSMYDNTSLGKLSLCTPACCVHQSFITQNNMAFCEWLGAVVQHLACQFAT